jgi:hypothetical protein
MFLFLFWHIFCLPAKLHVFNGLYFCFCKFGLNRKEVSLRISQPCNQFLFLQGHLISSQLFVFDLFFVFVLSLKLSARRITSSCPRLLKFL